MNRHDQTIEQQKRPRNPVDTTVAGTLAGIAASLSVSPRTWLLTGIPRSGTSLCCRLAGGLPDRVALSEPLQPHQWADCPDPRNACTRIETLVEQIRARIAVERRAPSIQSGGRLDDNLAASGHTDVNGLRRLRAEWGEIVLDKKPLSTRFGLLVKHNALFAALLPRLAASFPCLALVRNPLAVLASWQTVDLPVHRGRIPMGERFDPELRRTLDGEPETLRRQIVVLNWFFARYRAARCRAYLPPENVIRYEDLVESGGQALFRLLGHAEARPVEELKSRNDSAPCDKAMTETLLEALLEAGGPWTRFYSPEDCERVAEKIRKKKGIGLWAGGEGRTVGKAVTGESDCPGGDPEEFLRG